MAVYAIGDVQGCYDELRRLLDYVDFEPGRDQVWLTGDLVNRGTQSLETLRYVHELGEDARCVLGNHDLHLLARHSGVRRRRKDLLDRVIDAADADELASWLRSLPLFINDEKLGWSMVHAGLPPQWSVADAVSYSAEVSAALADDEGRVLLHEMYGDTPSRWDSSLGGLERLRFFINCMTRMRYCTLVGELDLSEKGPPGTQPDNLYPWFDIPERKSAEQRIAFGHWSTLGTVSRNNVVALDTGCVWGGQLTAARLDDGGERISIPCPGAARPRQ